MEAIKVLSDTKDTLKIEEMSEFQGKLKHRSPRQVQELAESLKKEGLIMPFVIWKHDGKNLLLDGHGRYRAIKYIIAEQNESDGQKIKEQAFPVIYIEAENEEEAKKALLQISSRYGNITRKGAAAFCATIPQYTAPAIKGFVRKEAIERPERRNENNRSVIRISIPTEMEVEVKELLKSVSYIRII